MRRLIAIIAAAALTFTAAARQRVKDVDTRVVLERDGSATVTQIWNVDVTEGTEWYIPVQNLGPMTVEDIQVSENGLAFSSVGKSWNVDWSRERKQGKCGMVPKSDGAELCWGIGQYGEHVWTVTYRLTGLVMAYDDADALIFTWIPPGMGGSPEHAKVTIIPGFDGPVWVKDNPGVWAFGFYGEINVADGAVVAETSESFGYSSKLITLVKWNQGIFQPTVVRGGPVQDMIDRALEGSSYGEDDDTPFIIIFGILFLCGFGLILWVGIASALGYKWDPKFFGKKKIEGWWRDAPLEGNLFAAYYALSKGRFSVGPAPANNLIGAFFLRWIMDGVVTVEPDPSSSKRVNLSFRKELLSADSVEQDLFHFARIASGDNLLLEKGEFEKWSTKNYNKVTAWPTRAQSRGKSWFYEKGYFVRASTCTTDGAKEACHVIEFQNFLKDFTISNQRVATDVKLWKDYLVYAQLFGIAEKVAQQFKKLYPAEFAEVANQTGMNDTTLWRTIYWTNNLSTRSFNNAVQKAGSVSGGGGRSSFGGGGGSFGGGFGGGAR
ncbi:MAG: DUF2207 domain-containing protein [Bacteroidales bacterium]|nr:DUF2207 domain-containing protein [Bacteroidales bacterium]MBO4586184.1 DUF2207 domain-containing protein [Bacteroidales bacterium]